MPDMEDDELEKMSELLAGAHESGPGPARADAGRADRRRTSRRELPSLVIGAGLDEVIHPTEARRTADLLGASYEYFPSASHFGLVMGARTWPEVAQSVLGWLEEHRHAMTAAVRRHHAGRRPPLSRRFARLWAAW